MCWKAETLLCRVPYSHGYGLHGGDIWLWELGCKEGRITKNWCFQTGVLEKTPEIPWTARRPKQSILKEINHEYSVEELMLKHQYFYHLMWRADSLELTLMLGKIEGRGLQRLRWLDGTTNSMEFEQTPGNGEGQGGPACCSPWGHRELDLTEWLNNKNNED